MTNAAYSIWAKEVFTGRQCPNCTCCWDEYGKWVAGTRFVHRSLTVKKDGDGARYLLVLDTRQCACGGEMIFGVPSVIEDFGVLP